jgi:hypothetical protein
MGAAADRQLHRGARRPKRRMRHLQRGCRWVGERETDRRAYGTTRSPSPRRVVSSSGLSGVVRFPDKSEAIVENARASAVTIYRDVARMMRRCGVDFGSSTSGGRHVSPTAPLPHVASLRLDWLTGPTELRPRGSPGCCCGCPAGSCSGSPTGSSSQSCSSYRPGSRG